MSQDVGRGFLDAAASAFLRRRLLGQAKPLECSPRKTDALVVDGLRPHPVPRQAAPDGDPVVRVHAACDEPWLRERA